MSHPSRNYEDSTPPIALDKKSTVHTSLAFILAIVAATWAASMQWNKSQSNAENLNSIVSDHARQLTTLQTTVGSLHDNLIKMQADQNSQLEILRYLARDRRGPVPDAAK
jgi:hypothetical protein